MPYFKPTESHGSGTDTSDATLDSNSRMLSSYTAYAKGTKYTGNITTRPQSSETISSAKTYSSGYYPNSFTVTPKSASLQDKSTIVSPTANWSGTYTNYASVTPDSGYDGMSSASVAVSMLRDNTLMSVSGVDTPSTVYNGDSSQSNSSKMLKVAPTKDGMGYTNSYLYVPANNYLGDATASDVVSGKTFSSANGIQITGTGSSGTDTSDATLDSNSRMLSGYTAYSKGVKYTGNIPTISQDEETIRSTKTYQAGYYPNSWMVIPKNDLYIDSYTIWTNQDPSSAFTSMSINYASFIDKILDYIHNVPYKQVVITGVSIQGNASTTITSSGANGYISRSAGMSIGSSYMIGYSSNNGYHFVAFRYFTMNTTEQSINIGTAQVKYGTNNQLNNDNSYCIPTAIRLNYIYT